jgi:2-polyprenyl-3-methyl-5-hydroxy-6-metoxy-1,4-benzoquinol methylase
MMFPLARLSQETRQSSENLEMNTTKTDREKSLKADEYLWDTEGSTEVHGFVWPELERRLQSLGGKSLLDLGCGNGALTARFTGLVPECVGVDFSRSGIEIARVKHPAAKFECVSIADPLPSCLRQKFDVVVAVEVIEHLLLPRQLFARAKEALKPGGYLIVTTPYHGYLKNMALALVNKFDSHWHPLRDYGHVKFFSRATLSEVFEEQQFSIDYFSRVGRIPAFARSMVMGAKLKGGG